MVLPIMAAAGPAAAAAGSAGVGAAGSAGFGSMIPSILGGAGMFAGGMSGFFNKGGSGFSGRDYERMLKIQNMSIQDRLKYARKAADKHGFHPLTALGLNPGASGGAFHHVGGRQGLGRSLEAMGAGLQRAFTGRSELQKAQIGELEARTNYYNALANKANSPPPMGQGDTVSEGELTKVLKAEVTAQRGHGIQAGPSGFFQFADRPDGSVQLFPTQKFQESTSEGFHALEYGIKMSKDYARGVSFNLMKGPKAMMARNQIRNVQRIVEKEYGGKWFFDPFARAWYPTNTNLLYNHPNLRRFGREYEYGSKQLVPSHVRGKTYKERILESPLYFD